MIHSLFSIGSINLNLTGPNPICTSPSVNSFRPQRITANGGVTCVIPAVEKPNKILIVIQVLRFCCSSLKIVSKMIVNMK